MKQKGNDIMIKNGRPVTIEADSNTIGAALLYALPDEKIAQISEWIKKNVRAADRNCSGYSSYGLKHELERDTGIYLTNNQFKHAMLLAGFVPINANELNWEFNIILTRDVIENPSPFFNWLDKYTDEDSMIGDFARDVLRDKNFPAMADYWVIRRYLESICACDGCMHCFEMAWKRWRNHKRNMKRREKLRERQTLHINGIST